jgi:hypothetical protein
MMCASRYQAGYRRGQPCPYRAAAIIASGGLFSVCGYHARAYAPRVVYPLDWNLERIRAWRLLNLGRLTREETP